jgi:cell division protein FtsN
MKQQQGGTFLGFVVGLVVGLAAALTVAIFVTKVPVPFLSKDPSQVPLSEAAEAKKNKDWNPNASLSGKSAVRAAPASAPPPAVVSPVPRVAAAASSAAQPATKAADPIADLAKARSSNPAADPFIYFVQAGAYRTAEDADAQKAKLSLLGVETKVTEREQSGRAVFRVRVGPFDHKEEADKAQERLERSGVEAVLVRVQR